MIVLEESSSSFAGAGPGRSSHWQFPSGKIAYCKTGGNHQHKYRSFKGLQMFFSELTGADQESSKERSKKERRAPFLRNGSDTFGLRFGTTLVLLLQGNGPVIPLFFWNRFRRVTGPKM